MQQGLNTDYTHAGVSRAEKLSEKLEVVGSRKVLVVRAEKTASRTDVQLFGSQEHRCRDDVKWTWRRASVHANVQGNVERRAQFKNKALTSRFCDDLQLFVQQ